MTPVLSIRLDFEVTAAQAPDTASRVAEILNRPCFAVLDRIVGASGELPKSAVAITEILLDLDATLRLTGTYEETVIARCDIEYGPNGRRFAVLVLPYVPRWLDSALVAIVELAHVLRAVSGAIATEPDYIHGVNYAFGALVAGPIDSSPRPGLSELRLRERSRGSNATEIGGPEWGMFLGAGHIARVSFSALRDSNAFSRVIAVAPDLIFIQLTADPLDDFTDAFETNLERAAEVLAPVLMDLTDGMGDA
jgi:hypothetical protein